MASIQELKARIDLHDLAQKLGLERPEGERGNYRSPHHKDKHPSISIFAGGKAWKDHSNDGAGGDCISLVQYVKNLPDVPSAMRELHEIYNIPTDRRTDTAPRPRRSKEAFIADQCRAQPDASVEYLRGRGVSEEVARWAVKCGAVGFNDWTSDRVEAGSFGYGGPAVAFICRDWVSGDVRAVDFRYLDPALNGGTKTKTVGDKQGVPFFIDLRHLQRAHRVYVFESAINVLCFESCGMRGTAGLAIRGTGNAGNLDLRLLDGKQVILCMDADQPNEKGKRPGDEAAWVLYDRLTAQGIAALMVDQHEWRELELNDAADIAKVRGLDNMRTMMQELEPWAIPGLPGRDAPAGRSRLFLPAHDFAVYWRFRAKPDFTTYVSKLEENPDGGADKLTIDDLCGFRVAALSRVVIQSATATMAGEAVDSQPTTVFAVSVQVARHGPKLIRRVFIDERLHNIDQWKKFGPVFNPSRFSRLINILERSADLGSRDAINFVGLAWRRGVPVVNEGPDCYFTEPEKQCPYHNMAFPVGTVDDARRVIGAYQSTYRGNAVALLLTWALGAHLKAFIGFWPHMTMQADKGSGKSTIIKRLERSIGMTMFGGQSLKTEFRILTSISHTSHPIGWEEISTSRQDIIDLAVAMLQESYQHTVTRRGSEMTEFLMCAPVLLAGEDVPVKSLTGKIVRCSLVAANKGALMPESLPKFPVRPWLDYLATLHRDQVMQRLDEWERWCWDGCRAAKGDSGASRMVRNYACLALAWSLLAEFTGLAREQDGFLADLRAEMNGHIAETAGDREPWVWILETLISEIESHNYQHPHTFALMDGDAEVLILRPQHVMDHISSTNRLRDKWNGLPVKSGRVFKRQLEQRGVIHKDDVERVINGRRHGHLTALSLKKMAEYGLYISQPTEPAPAADGWWERAANE